MNENYTYVIADYNTVNEKLVDSQKEIQIENKTVLEYITGITKGESNSNLITFSINRFLDGIDLSTKRVKILYKIDDEIKAEPTVNLKYSNTKFKFSWLISGNVTVKSGKVPCAIEFFDDENYSMKTKTFYTMISDSLDDE